MTTVNSKKYNTHVIDADGGEMALKEISQIDRYDEPACSLEQVGFFVR